MEVAVSALSTAQAGAALAAAGVVDPRGVNSPHAIARAGRCFHVQTDQGAAVLVLRVQAGVLWVDGAAGRGVIPALRELVPAIARRAGCARARFESTRPGLLRLAARCGWQPYERHASGAVVMEKETPWIC